MKVVLDTNVIVSGFLWKGAPYQLLKAADHREIEILSSIEILEEVERVFEEDRLKPAVRRAGLSARLIMNKIYSIVTAVDAEEDVTVVEEDPEDNKFLECAIEGEADYIVSGDKHLLGLGNYKEIRIIRPREMLELMGKQ